MPVALEVQRFKVVSLNVDIHDVSWETAETTEDILDYTFQLLRSEGPEGPYDALTPEMEDQFRFIDNAIRRGHQFATLFYKLVVKHKPSGDTKVIGPVARLPEADLVAVELRKHMNLLMREFIGRRCWVLPVRTFGQRCHCWSPTLSKRRVSMCFSCFDTGFVRGYLRPIESWISIDPTTQAEQNSSTGPTQQQNTTARMGHYPPLKPRDVIIEGENNRWRVVQVTATEQTRATLRQELQLHLIPKGDIEYKLEFDIGQALKDVWLSPSRNFTNPQNLETFEDEEIPDIFSVYNTTYPSQR